MNLRYLIICVNLLCLMSGPAGAHVSEQGFVLLLPTEVYITAGVATVAVTVVALFVLPARVVVAAFGFKKIRAWGGGHWRDVTSLLSLALLGFAIYIGPAGSRDPLSNFMPLGFWTLGWIGLISLSGLLGNIWTWLNPWRGLYTVIGPIRPLVHLPPALGLWPATALLIGFGAFLLADIAPDDPTRLARFVALYWLLAFCGMILCGPRWLDHCELGHAIFAAYGRLAPLQLASPAGIGGPGWQLIAHPAGPAAGVFALTLLAVGSFDGVNETYWWLGLIGVNPLEFPGRSAVVVPTLVGLGLSILGLCAVFALAVWLGIRISGRDVPFRPAFTLLALSVLPIALVYHVAHYLTSFMVSIQYTIAAISDPFARGADWLGIEPFRVTTGFFNSMHTVRQIWMTQAGLVVFGHVWSVLLSHRLALMLFTTDRRAALATLPLSLFMIAYTLLGLWLLAAPKGA